VSYLLDTNVVSEVTRPRPSPAVVRWLGAVPESALHLSVLTLGEIRRGIEGVSDARRRERLRVWLERELPARLEDRLLPLDVRVADRWGRLLAEAKAPVPAIDGLLAATALVHGLRMATRNVADFSRFEGLEVVDPWA
jgi:predicted nucleic acid-binding protein